MLRPGPICHSVYTEIIAGGGLAKFPIGIVPEGHIQTQSCLKNDVCTYVANPNNAISSTEKN
jgi:hypothetical protein